MQTRDIHKTLIPQCSGNSADRAVIDVNRVFTFRAQRSALRREREAFYAVISREIDAVWGWNGNSAAKVLHLRYTSIREVRQLS
jgi:hypothetical protein